MAKPKASNYMDRQILGKKQVKSRIKTKAGKPMDAGKLAAAAPHKASEKLKEGMKTLPKLQKDRRPKRGPKPKKKGMPS